VNEEKVKELVGVCMGNGGDLGIGKGGLEEGEGEVGISEGGKKMEMGLWGGGGGGYVGAKRSCGDIDIAHSLLLANTGLEGT
ncbi:hypothetical protein, partial [Neisseria sicca]|uniref:hypothetical protein n=1 Tax=Neisseria sicca TaxID=490 RepID=UPI003F68A652